MPRVREPDDRRGGQHLQLVVFVSVATAVCAARSLADALIPPKKTSKDGKSADHSRRKPITNLLLLAKALRGAHKVAREGLVAHIGSRKYRKVRG